MNKGGLLVVRSYRGGQAEHRLFGHQALGEIHIILIIWKVIHVDSHLDISKNSIFFD